MTILRKIYETALRWLWPEICPFCGKASSRGICGVCRKELEKLKIQEPRCKRCGKPIARMEKEYCHDCSHTHHHYNSGLELWLHRKPVSTSIYQFKYHNQRSFGIWYAREMAEQFALSIRRWDPDLIIPIPLHSTRKRKRGYNQAQIVACELGRRMGMPVDATSLCRRIPTSPQKTLGHRERKANLRKAFALGRGFVPVPTVLLVDDIYTTGNTMDAAADILKRAGVEKVYFLTISIGQGY